MVGHVRFRTRLPSSRWVRTDPKRGRARRSRRAVARKPRSRPPRTRGGRTTCPAEGPSSEALLQSYSPNPRTILTSPSKSLSFDSKSGLPGIDALFPTAAPPYRIVFLISSSVTFFCHSLSE